MQKPNKEKQQCTTSTANSDGTINGKQNDKNIIEKDGLKFIICIVKHLVDWSVLHVNNKQQNWWFYS